MLQLPNKNKLFSFGSKFINLIVLNIALSISLCSLARAEGEITIVVPFGVGGPQDILLRSFTAELSQSLDTPVLIKNIPGAGGTIGTAYVAKSAPESKTFLFAANGHHFTPYLYPDLTFDPHKDFTGVALFAQGGMFLGIPDSLGTESLPQYIELIRANPAKYNYASGGNGSATHLGMAYFLSKFDLKMQHIPMKSAGESLTEVLTGRVQGAMFAINAVKTNKENNKIKFIANTGKQRDPLSPEIPTVAEITHTDFSFEGWIGLLAPRGVPAAEVERLNHSFRKVLAEQAVKEKLSRFGVTTTSLSVKAFNAFLAQDAKDAAMIFKISHAKIN